MSDSIDYVKKVVGPTLARGCAAVARENPTDPVDYLALWLKRYLECVAIKEETLEELNDARVKTADEEVRPRQPTTRGPHFPRPGPRPKTSPPCHLFHLHAPPMDPFMKKIKISSTFLLSCPVPCATGAATPPHGCPTCGSRKGGASCP